MACYDREVNCRRAAAAAFQVRAKWSQAVCPPRGTRPDQPPRSRPVRAASCCLAWGPPAWLPPRPHHLRSARLPTVPPVRPSKLQPRSTFPCPLGPACRAGVRGPPWELPLRHRHPHSSRLLHSQRAPKREGLATALVHALSMRTALQHLAWLGRMRQQCCMPQPMHEHCPSPQPGPARLIIRAILPAAVAPCETTVGGCPAGPASQHGATRRSGAACLPAAHAGVPGSGPPRGRLPRVPGAAGPAPAGLQAAPLGQGAAGAGRAGAGRWAHEGLRKLWVLEGRAHCAAVQGQGGGRVCKVRAQRVPQRLDTHQSPDAPRAIE